MSEINRQVAERSATYEVTQQLTSASDLQWATMGEISDVVGGGTPKTNDSANFEGGDIPWITPADLSGYTAKYISRGNRFITRKGLASSAARLLPAGTVLFTSRAPIGYVAIAGNPIATNQGFKSFVLKDCVLPEYVYWWLKGSKHRAEELASGTTFLELSGANAKKIPIPVVPLERQRAVVAEIEKQFSRLDEAVTGLKRAKANLKRYKASILKAAVEGRLVPTEADLAHREGRSYETGIQLLQRILETRRSQWKGKYDQHTLPSDMDDFDLPADWTWTTVSQLLCERIVNGLSVKESLVPTHTKALRLSAMTESGLDYDDFRFLPVDPARVSDIIVQKGDFFVSRGNGSLKLVGRGSRAQTPTHDVIFPDTMMRVRFTATASVHAWVQAIWSARLVRTQMEARVKTTAGIYKIAQPELASITLPLPPLAEQHRIVAEVDRLLSIAREAEAEVETNLKRAQSLRQAILSKSFQGAPA